MIDASDSINPYKSLHTLDYSRADPTDSRQLVHPGIRTVRCSILDDSICKRRADAGQEFQLLGPRFIERYSMRCTAAKRSLRCASRVPHKPESRPRRQQNNNRRPLGRSMRAHRFGHGLLNRSHPPPHGIAMAGADPNVGNLASRTARRSSAMRIAAGRVAPDCEISPPPGISGELGTSKSSCQHRLCT